MESRQRKRFGIFCLYLILLLVVGCATTSLEQRVARLENQIEELEDTGLMEKASEVGSATRMYGRSALTGAEKSVANISESGLVEGDLCTVIDDNGYAYWYRWDADSELVQSIPRVIVPNVSDGTGRWILIPRIYASSFYSAAADGEHLMDPSNSNSLPSSPPTGSLSVRDDTMAMYIADSSGNWWPYGFPTEEYITNYTIPIALHWGSTITNYGATGAIELILQKAVLGMELNFHVNVAQPLRVDPNIMDKFIGTGFTDGEYYGADGIGEYITIRAVQNGAASTDVDWAIINIGGIWTQQTP